jgi:hypothetical protein
MHEIVEEWAPTYTKLVKISSRCRANNSFDTLQRLMHLSGVNLGELFFLTK